MTPHDYALRWYELHAGQRMQMVGFWLIATGLVANAYVAALAAGYHFAAAAVATAGAVSAVGFMALDIRTRRLVQVGEHALLELEEALASASGVASIRLVYAADRERSSRFASYRVILQWMQGITAVSFIIAAIAAAVG